VVILGAGPAGLVLGNLLLQNGIGFLAPNTVHILDRYGLAEGLRRHGRAHGVCEFRTEHGRFSLDYGTLGRGDRHTVYPQQQLVTDLLSRYLDAGGRISFETRATAVLDADSERPSVTVCGADARPGRWEARYVAGCDGRHGAARRSLPSGAVTRHHRDHNVSWLGLLVAAPPSLHAVAYAVHGRGFAGHMARTPEITRYYLQCERGDSTGQWSEDRVWDELALRMRAAEYGPLNRGPVIQRSVIDLESDVLEPLRHGSLFLVGDAASLISPSAAKGANLAVLEAEILARALVGDLKDGDRAGLAGYSSQCLAHIWRAQEFSHWMIRLLHGAPGSDGESQFSNSLQRSRIESLRTSRSHQDWFAENYVGV